MTQAHFYDSDIVTWEGIICKFGTIKNLLQEGDVVCHATDNEGERYLAANNPKI